MKPVFQTIFRPPSGNCWAACVASILERPLWTVPNFAVGQVTKGRDWWRAYAEWLNAHGLGALCIEASKDPNWCLRFPTDFPVIAVVKSTTGDWNHCVVVDPVAGNVLHDPNPSSDLPAKPEIVQFEVIFRRAA
jgi:hypothetical protein